MLRLSREEDWSDWLAWLLKESGTGILAAAMFGGNEKAYVRPHVVKREESLPGGYRPIPASSFGRVWGYTLR